MRKLTALVALTTTACSSWHYETAPLPSVLSERNPKSIRVQLRSGEWIEIYDVTLQGDSVFGLIPAHGNVAPYRLAVATKDVERVSTKRLNAGRTALAVLAITVAVSTIAGATAASSTASSSNSSCQAVRG